MRRQQVLQTRQVVIPPGFYVDEQALSFLRPPAALRKLLVDMGIRELAWQDVTAQTAAAMGAPTVSSPRGVHLLLGPNAAVKLVNLSRNLAEGPLALVQGLFERS